jgi:hypothetical protein
MPETLTSQESGVAAATDAEFTFDYMPIVRIHCSEWYRDEAFLQWLNTDPQLATWHKQGLPPHDQSDVFLIYHGPEESTNYPSYPDYPGVPDKIWKQIAEKMRAEGWAETECLLWLSP